MLVIITCDLLTLVSLSHARRTTEIVASPFMVLLYETVFQSTHILQIYLGHLQEQTKSFLFTEH